MQKILMLGNIEFHEDCKTHILREETDAEEYVVNYNQLTDLIEIYSGKDYANYEGFVFMTCRMSVFMICSFQLPADIKIIYAGPYKRDMPDNNNLLCVDPMNGFNKGLEKVKAFIGYE